METRELVPQAPRRAEILAALSVAIDLGLGQPAEHMLRSALIATRLADALGLDRDTRDTAYYTTLVMWIGCHADSHEYAQWFGDDIAVRREAYLVDWAGLPYLRFLMRNVAHGEPVPQRVRVLAALMRDARGQLSALIHSHCTSAALLAERVGLTERVQAALPFTFERYDGGGLPRGVAGDELPVEMRVAQMADVLEVHHRLFGLEAATRVARDRSGGQFDPAIADVFVAQAESLLAPEDDIWIAALREAPDRAVHLDDDQVDDLLVAMGDFVDLTCPFTLGHSRGVAALAGDAARSAGLEAGEVRLLRRAGHVHDLGRIGVTNQIWSKQGPLSATEWERVRLHPYLTGRILHQIGGLEAEAQVAVNHHERPDGSGYPRGLAGPALRFPDRILAAAAGYQSAREPRPYREALDPAAAARHLREQAAHGAFDSAAVDAVLAAAGQGPSRVTSRPDGLTVREIEVLGLVARGTSNREIAQRLGISEKTARNHIEHVYAKLGVSNRIGASMYALQHGLAAPDA